MKKTIKEVLPVLCIVTFAVTAATSLPLFILYLRNETMKSMILQDLHVWFGFAFIIFVLLRIALNRKFVGGTFKQLIRKRR
jgi:hypothetical protein